MRVIYTEVALTLALSREREREILRAVKIYFGMHRRHSYHKNIAALDRSRQGINQSPMRSRP